ncbi:MAG: hypothetical protein HYY93_07425 [Planctomycetes bacterium]|nr:hypothetical protein [Planctomycetota bacterium]
MPRFVIQRHDVAPGVTHYDLMLEHEGVLKTWRLTDPQAALDGLDVDLEAIRNHRIAYLEYEGEISGGRGRVQIWDRGEYDARWGEERAILITFQGVRLTGSRILSRTGEGPAWRMTRFLGEG